MNIDKYTKTVLTVIALCLVWLCVRDHVIQPVVAQKKAEPTSVVISGISIPDPRGRNYPFLQVLPVTQR